MNIIDYVIVIKDFCIYVSEESSVSEKRLLIIDARSYTASVANRAKGGGCECSG